MQPLWVDDAAEAPNESCRLRLNLCVHPEVSHEVDVADPAGIRGKTSVNGKHLKPKKGSLLTLSFQLELSLHTCFHW